MDLTDHDDELREAQDEASFSEVSLTSQLAAMEAQLAKQTAELAKQRALVAATRLQVKQEKASLSNATQTMTSVRAKNFFQVFGHAKEVFIQSTKLMALLRDGTFDKEQKTFYDGAKSTAGPFGIGDELGEKIARWLHDGIKGHDGIQNLGKRAEFFLNKMKQIGGDSVAIDDAKPVIEAAVAAGKPPLKMTLADMESQGELVAASAEVQLRSFIQIDSSALATDTSETRVGPVIAISILFWMVYNMSLLGEGGIIAAIFLPLYFLLKVLAGCHPTNGLSYDGWLKNDWYHGKGYEDLGPMKCQWG